VDALVVGAAPRPAEEAFYRALLADAPLVVAADAAGEWCTALGRTPEIVVGDFDSSATGAPGRLRGLGVDVRSVPAHKDVSDLDLAVAAAREQGAREVVLTAAFSARLDHTLAAFGTLAASADVLGEAREPDFVAWALDAIARPSLRLAVAPGTLVSVFAVGPARGVTLEGFEYPLRDAPLDALSTLGLSNVAAAEHVVLSVASGCLIVYAVVTDGMAAPQVLGDAL